MGFVPFGARGRTSFVLGLVLLFPVGGCFLVDVDSLTGGSEVKVRDAGSMASPLGDEDSDGGEDAAAGNLTPPVDAGEEDAAAAGFDAVASRPDAGDDAAANRPDAGADAVASGEDAGGGACGPTDTIANCGACGVACDTRTGSPSCDGTSCTYACRPGRTDCDLEAPDKNGCECATPACCGTSCQTIHSNGVGQNFYDCNAAGTNTDAAATEACVAYALSVGGTPSDCTDGWYCQDQPSQVCFNSSGPATQYCWGYGAPSDQVFPNYCPSSAVGSWD
jgi:hypothetical protein